MSRWMLLGALSSCWPGGSEEKFSFRSCDDHWQISEHLLSVISRTQTPSVLLSYGALWCSISGLNRHKARNAGCPVRGNKGA